MRKQLDIKLSADTAKAYEAAANKDVVLEAGAVKDSNSNESPAKTISVVEHASLASATYVETTNLCKEQGRQVFEDVALKHARLEELRKLDNGTGLFTFIKGDISDKEMVNFVQMGDVPRTYASTSELERDFKKHKGTVLLC